MPEPGGQQQSSAPRRRRRWKRWLLLPPLLLLIAWLGRGIWLPWIIEPLLRDQLGAALGCTVTIGQLSSDGTSELLITDLRCRPDDDSRLAEEATLRRLELRFDIWAWFSGDRILDRLEVTDLRLHLSPTNAPVETPDEDAEPSLASLLEGLPDAGLLDQLPSIEATGLDLAYGDWQVADAELRYRLATKQEAARLQLDLNRPSGPGLTAERLRVELHPRPALLRERIADLGRLIDRYPVSEEALAAERLLRWQLLLPLLPAGEIDLNGASIAGWGLDGALLAITDADPDGEIHLQLQLDAVTRPDGGRLLRELDLGLRWRLEQQLERFAARDRQPVDSDLLSRHLPAVVGYRELLALHPLLPAISLQAEDLAYAGRELSQLELQYQQGDQGAAHLSVDLAGYRDAHLGEDLEQTQLRLRIDQQQLELERFSLRSADSGGHLDIEARLPRHGLAGARLSLEAQRLPLPRQLWLAGELTATIDDHQQATISGRQLRLRDTSGGLLSGPASLAEFEAQIDLEAEDLLHRPLSSFSFQDLSLHVAAGPTGGEKTEPVADNGDDRQQQQDDDEGDLGGQLTRMLSYLRLLERLPRIDVDGVDASYGERLRIAGGSLQLQPEEGRDVGLLRVDVERLELAGRRVGETRLRLRIDADALRLGSAEKPGLHAAYAGGQLDVYGSLQREGSAELRLHVDLDDMLILASGDRHVRCDAQLQAQGVIGERVTVTGDVDVVSALWFAEFAGGAVATPAPAEVDSGDPLENLGLELPMASEGGYPLPGLGGLEWLRFKVAITTPQRGLVRNNLLAALFDLDLHLGGDGAQPAISGDIVSRTGELRLLAGTFLRIKQLELNIPDRPGAGPNITFVGATDLGRMVVELRLNGPLAAPTLTISSDGAQSYSQDELLSLLVFGRLPGGSLNDSQGQQDFLVGQALRLAGKKLFDRPPKLYPGGNAITGGWRFQLGAQLQGADDEPLPFAVHDSGPNTAFAVEKRFSRRWSVISRIDEDNNPSADLQYRLAFGGKEPVDHDAEGDEWPEPAYLERVHYRGNERVDDDELDRALAAPLLGPADLRWSAAIRDDAAFRLRMSYRRLGYSGTTVVHRLLGDGSVVFDIEEGTRYDYAGLEVIWVDAQGRSVAPPFEPGGAAIDRDRIAAIAYDESAGQGSVVTPRLVAAQADSIGNFLRSLGYRDAEVMDSRLTEHTGERRGIRHRVFAGPLYRCGQVRWQPAGIESVLPVRIRDYAAQLSGEPCGVGLAGNLASEVQSALRADGHLRATASDRTQPTGGEALIDIIIVVDPGAIHILGDSRIVGARRVADSFIERVVDLQPGEVLTTERMRRLQERLLRTGLFRSVLVSERDDQADDDGQPKDDARDAEPGATFPRHVSDIVVTVEERQPYEARLRIGYGTVDRLRLGADLLWRSPVGRAEILRIGGEVNDRLRRVDASVTFPYLFAEPWLSARITPFWQRAENDEPRYDEELLGVIGRIDMLVDDPLRLGVGMIAAHIEDHLGGGNDRVYTPFAEAALDLRDSAYKPRQGLRAFLRHELTGTELGSTLTYTKTRLSTAAYLPLGPWLTVAVGGQGGVISTGDGTVSSDLPTSFRFAAGGAFSVRGFEEDSLGPRDGDGDITGGDVLAVLRSELRMRLFLENLQLVAFSDWGNVFNEVDQVSFDDLRHGAGIGTRYITPAGAIMLDLGFNVDPEEGEDDYQLHLSFGMPF